MPEANYATFTPPEGADFRFLMGSIEQGGQRTAAGRAKRVLVDLLALEEPPEVESLLLSHHVGLHLASLERIAVVVAHRSGLGEGVAQRLGANMRVFESRIEAVAWLEAK